MSVQPYLRECEISDAFPDALTSDCPKYGTTTMAEEAQKEAATSAVAVEDVVQSLPAQTEEAAADTKGSMCGGVQVSQSLSSLTEKVAARSATARAKKEVKALQVASPQTLPTGQSLCPRVAFKDGLRDYHCARS